MEIQTANYTATINGNKVFVRQIEVNEYLKFRIVESASNAKVLEFINKIINVDDWTIYPCKDMQAEIEVIEGIYQRFK